MKILITLILLTISPSLFGSDDLSGKKIACYKEVDDNIFLLGFYFSDSSKAYVYTESNIIPMGKRWMTYETSISIINFYTNNGSNLKFTVNRRTLEIKDQNKKTAYLENDCKVISKSIKSFFEEKLSKYKKQNKI